MSHQILIVRSGSISPLITVILADVKQPTRKTLLCTETLLKPLGRKVDVSASFVECDHLLGKNSGCTESSARQMNFVGDDLAGMIS